MDIGSILNFVKDTIFNTTLYCVLMGVSFILLFLPKAVLKWVRLDEFSEKNAQWIGIVFVFSAIIAIVKILKWVFYKIQRHFKTKAAFKRMHERLWKLYPAERKIIIKMYRASDRTIWLHPSSSSATVLLNQNMIQHGSPIFSKCYENPYYLQPWVCEYLKDHPEYLEESCKGKRSDKA